jgi:phage terminase large subunit-like protein
MWLEEIASWRYPEAFWEGAELCLRIGAAQGIITGTPKAIPLIRDLVQGKKGKDGKRTPRPDLFLTRGSTYENQRNLSGAFLGALRDQYEGTNLARQELYAEILEDIEGALWTYELIEKNRVAAHPALPVLAVAVDPTTSLTGAGDECGIVVGGLGEDLEAYVLADRSTRGTPDHWAREAVQAFHDFRADHITYEGNFARDVVRRTIGTVDPNVPLKEVTATRGKAIRAEPVSALYEQGRVHHAGMFPRLEDEMASWYPGVQGEERSPNRLDALVWLITDLMLGERVSIAAPVSTGTRRSPWRF